MAEAAQVIDLTKGPPKYQLVVDPLSVTVAQLGQVLNSIQFIFEQETFEQFPDNIKHLFQEVGNWK